MQQLQTAIDEENSKKTLEINEIKDIMASQQQALAQLIKSGKSQSLQANAIAMIDELRLDAEKLEAQTHTNQGVYDDLVQEIEARLEQRIKEVKDKV